MKSKVYEKTIRDCGLKVTRARLAVLAILDSATKPQSIDFIHQAAGKMGLLDRVTVYRTLESFHQAGLVERVRAGDRSRRYHLAPKPGHPAHPHFYCSCCGKLECLPEGIVRIDLKQLEKEYPARVDHLQINLEGFCPKCLAEGEG